MHYLSSIIVVIIEHFQFCYFLVFVGCLFQIGMVIDLTNTTRYYPPSDWKKQAIKHVKVRFGWFYKTFLSFFFFE